MAPRALTEPLSTGIIEIRSIRVGVVALKAVHTGFFVAMSRRGHLYGSVSTRQGWRAAGAGGRRGPSGRLTPSTPASGSTAATAGSGSASRRTATTPTPRCAGATAAGPCSWHWTGEEPHGAVAGRGGTTCPPTSCPSWSPEAPRGREEWLDKIPEDAWAGGQGPEAGGGPGRGLAASGRSFLPRALAACVPSTGDPPGPP